MLEVLAMIDATALAFDRCNHITEAVDLERVARPAPINNSYIGLHRHNSNSNMFTNFNVVLLAVLMAAAASTAFKTGAPAGACSDMVPQHGVGAQTTPAPYTVTVTKRGALYDLKIAGKTAADTVKGFMVMVRQRGNPVGQFVVAGSDNKHVHYVDCGGKARVSFGELVCSSFLARINNNNVHRCFRGRMQSAVTHQQYGKAPSSVTVTWDPKGVKGSVVFRSTILLNGGVFWVGVESAPLKLE